MSLSDPSFIDRDPEAITAELIASWEDLTGKSLYPGQPEALLIDLLAYRETLVRIGIQEAAKQNLVAFARYPMLDYLGQLVGVTRLDGELDDALRERIQLAPEAFSCAGSRLSYIFWARSSHAAIVDVEVLSHVPGVVTIYPLTNVGAPTSEVVDAVLATCSTEKVRPLTDQVEVVAPGRAEFDIAVDVVPYAWADVNSVQTQAEAACTDYAAGLRLKLGVDVVRSQISAVVQQLYGVYNVDVTSPAADIIRASNQWGDCTSITINMLEAVVG